MHTRDTWRSYVQSHWFTNDYCVTLDTLEQLSPLFREDDHPSPAGRELKYDTLEDWIDEAVQDGLLSLDEKCKILYTFHRCLFPGNSHV